MMLTSVRATNGSYCRVQPGCGLSATGLPVLSVIERSGVGGQNTPSLASAANAPVSSSTEVES